MTGDRFDNLEGGKPLPDDIKKTLSGLGRFDHLEIGARTPEPPHPAPPHTAEKILCTHCGQPNEAQRETCWACFRTLAAAPAPAKKVEQDITIVLDGFTYRSSDPNLPPDVKVLMDQIRKNGFSQELLAQWRSWRATRNETAPAERPYADPSLVPVENQGKDPLTGNEVFKGLRSAVIRLDGKMYDSTDKDLSPEMRELFQYIENYGVTPQLMEHLRGMGKKATLRPATTPAPSAEDLAFWKDVQQTSPAAEADAVGQRGVLRTVVAVLAVLWILLKLLGH